MRQNHSPHRSPLALGIVIVLMAAVIGSRDTWATYTSQAVSGKNTMRGGSIELSVLPDSLPDDRAVMLAADSKHSFGMVVENDGYNTLGYRARFVTSGDADLCAALHLTAKRAGKEVYTGGLVDFEYASEDPLERHQTDTWQFLIGTPESLSEFDGAATCELRWHLDAWQDRFLALGMGWYDGVEGETFIVGIEPAQDQIPEAKAPTLPESSLAVPVVDEAIIPDNPLVMISEPIPDPEVTSPVAAVEEGVSSETKEKEIE